MDTTRRSFFGLLGGALVAAPAVAAPVVAPPDPTLRIDEWDDADGIRRFHIETTEDVDLGVFFWISGSSKKAQLGSRSPDTLTNGFPSVLQVETPRQVFIPLLAAKDDVNELGLERRAATLRRLAGEGKPVVHVTHLRKATGVELRGTAVLPREVSIEDMRVLVPVRMTVAAG